MDIRQIVRWHHTSIGAGCEAFTRAGLRSLSTRGSAQRASGLEFPYTFVYVWHICVAHTRLGHAVFGLCRAHVSRGGRVWGAARCVHADPVSCRAVGQGSAQLPSGERLYGRERGLADADFGCVVFLGMLICAMAPFSVSVFVGMSALSALMVVGHSADKTMPTARACLRALAGRAIIVTSIHHR